MFRTSGLISSGSGNGRINKRKSRPRPSTLLLQSSIQRYRGFEAHLSELKDEHECVLISDDEDANDSDADIAIISTRSTPQSSTSLSRSSTSSSSTSFGSPFTPQSSVSLTRASSSRKSSVLSTSRVSPPFPVPLSQVARPERERADIIYHNNLLSCDALLLDAGHDVELSDHSFMRIVEHQTDEEHGHHVRGYRLLSQNHYELLMPEDRVHELVQLVRGDRNLDTTSSLSIVAANEVVRNCKIHFTNQHYHNVNYERDIQGYNSIIELPVYFCRWASTDNNIRIDDGDPIKPPVLGKIAHLRALQADGSSVRTISRGNVALRAADGEIRAQWRGHTTLRGSSITYRSGIRKQKFSFGDCFAGAGGTSCGALSAGLSMKFAFDLDRWATETYTTNFGHTGTHILNWDVQDFVRTATLSNNLDFQVDFLHLSPPCQPFCGANRSPNEEEDQQNLEAFGQVRNLLEVCKPRIATLEEAKSLTDIDKRTYFRQLISMFVNAGYSIQWKAVELNSFGVPQTRNRTIIIASGPGEQLPSFPRATHGIDGGLKPPPTIRAALTSIPADAPHQDEIARMVWEQIPYDDSKLHPTILTRPKPNHYHPSGRRRLSTREAAALQTFPHHFIFEGAGQADRWRQIGNAVPPLFAAEMFRHLKIELMGTDEEETRDNRI